MIILFRGIPDNPQKRERCGREVIPGWFLSAHNIQWLMGPGTAKNTRRGFEYEQEMLASLPEGPQE